MTAIDNDPPPVWAPGVEPGIAEARRAGRKPSTGERWAAWKYQVRNYDPKLWRFLAGFTALMVFVTYGTWLTLKVVDGFNAGQVEMAKTLVGDRDAAASGDAADMQRFLQQAGDPFAKWKAECIPSNHTKTVVGVSVDRNGKPTDNLNRARGWELVMAIQALGPVELDNVYVGDVEGTPVASATPTPDAPGKLCAPFNPAQPTTGNS
jgi:hypothetical protein